MKKTHIITIAGRLGSGKSSTAKELAKRLKYQHFSSGDLFREIAAEHNMDLLSANKHAEDAGFDIDYQVDQRLREIGETETDKVIDSRTAWHWIPQSFKVYLYIDTRTAANRIFANLDARKSANEHIPDTVEDYIKQLDSRYSSENRRYTKLYGIAPALESNYDLVINTAEYGLGDVVSMIERAYKQWLAN